MNINIGKTIVRKMAEDESQPERPLIHLIDSIFNEAVKSDNIYPSDIYDALNIAIDSNRERGNDE